MGKRENRGPEHGLAFPGDGHEKEVDAWRYRALACDLVGARRRRSHNPRLRFTRCDPGDKSDPDLQGLIQKCPTEMEGRAMTSACSSCAVLSPSNWSLIYFRSLPTSSSVEGYEVLGQVFALMRHHAGAVPAAVTRITAFSVD